jgi:hypothetical protein
MVVYGEVVFSPFLKYCLDCCVFLIGHDESVYFCCLYDPNLKKKISRSGVAARKFNLIAFDCFSIYPTAAPPALLQ